ncbi:Conserved hypothetical protein [Clostridium acetobutylicum EA 2018]|uniref:motility associated factor glycosyltransferase family protein n=1 Tax=Clostridium acetobutylicum TaxID=1488 RepID=UPI000200A6EB|nr:6-hydroxymethylpterin diphosphokinase MptE-like protein [Clostridium acetobutylicum]ADZ21251.1 Conserved hypothetical protein [Clostridium acetobutylicum EA 2018]
MERKLEIVKTKTENYTIKVDGVFIHSKYDPLREAETFAIKNIELIKNSRYIVIYGFGLGYHIEAVLRHMNEESMLAVFDADLEVIKEAKKQSLYEKLIKNPRLKCFFDYGDEFLKEFSKSLSLAKNIIIYRPSLKVLPEEFGHMARLLKGYELAKIEIEKHGKLAEYNYDMNLKKTHKKMQDFLSFYSFGCENIVLVSSGPSLDYNIESLKKVRDRVKIFCAGSAAEFLIKNHIIPDMICIIDPQDIVYTQLQSILNKNIPLCFLSSACSRVVSEWSGEKFLFFNDFNAARENNDVVVETGKSVATAILSIAVLKKPKKVIFIGQDLAYLNGKSHHDNYGSSQSSGIKKVRSVDGEYLETNEGFLYFKSWIEQKIMKSKDIEFINCSSGAEIKGTIASKLIDAIK